MSLILTEYTHAMNPFLFILLAFILLLITEYAVIWRFFKKTINYKKILLIVLLINLVTWPTLNMLLLTLKETLLLILALEIIIVIIEATFIKLAFNSTWKKATIASLLANTASFLLTPILLLFIL